MDRKFAGVDYDSPLWTFFISPASVLSFVLTICSAFVFSPLLHATFLPESSKMIKPKKRTYVHSLLASTVHSLTNFSLTVYILYYGLLGPTKVYSTSALGYTAIHIGLGYTLGDVFVCLSDFYLRWEYINHIHHFVVFVSLSSALLWRGEMMYFAVALIITEGSTPFVNWRFLLSELGKKNSFWYTFASLGMVASFFVCRIAKIPWYWYQLIATVLSPESANFSTMGTLWLILIVSPFDVLNIYWFSKMVKGIAKFAKKRTAVE